MTQKDARNYVRIAVDLPANRKLKGAPAATKWLDVSAVCWSGQNIANGEVDPVLMCAVAGVPNKHANDLVKRGRWHRQGHDCPDCPQPESPDDVVIHHYLRHQTSAEKVTRVRNVRSIAGRRANHERWGHDGEFEQCWRCQE